MNNICILFSALFSLQSLGNQFEFHYTCNEIGVLEIAI